MALFFKLTDRILLNICHFQASGKRMVVGGGGSEPRGAEIKNLHIKKKKKLAYIIYRGRP